ncbi:MAG TPA: hypothetical protein VLB27_00885 [candidate division Zixibacteria bacterium]|nr:hypothetical protein [candidate division Zixibacteria bacterium]
MLFDDYLIFGLVWFSGLFFIWYAGAITASPALYRRSQIRHLSYADDRSALPGWWRSAFALFALSDVAALYLVIRGYWGEPPLWGVLLTHLGLAPRFVVRFVYPPALRERRRVRLAARSDAHVRATALASLAVGVMIFVTYYRL